MPNCISQWRSSPYIRVCHQQEGAEQGGTGWLGVRTGHECPEGNLRELGEIATQTMGQSERGKKGGKRERELSCEKL